MFHWHLAALEFVATRTLHQSEPAIQTWTRIVQPSLVSLLMGVVIFVIFIIVFSYRASSYDEQSHVLMSRVFLGSRAYPVM